MKIGSIRENLTSERRVALTPEISKKFIIEGFEINLQKNYATHLGFEDKEYESLNVNFYETEEEVLIVSQFTLSAITDKGNKPTFHKAAKPEKAKLLYDEFVNLFKKGHQLVKEGKFGASMNISLINKGPVTFNFKT